MVLAQLFYSTGALSNCQLSTGLFEPIGTGTISLYRECVNHFL